jgi:hypothetical protein
MAAQNIRIFHPTLARAKNGLIYAKDTLLCAERREMLLDLFLGWALRARTRLLSLSSSCSGYSVCQPKHTSN